MSFLKTSFWGALSTGITMLCGLVTTKYVAVIIGPEGMAYVGQFTNITTLLALFATGACATGVVKYVAQYQQHEVRRKFVANAFLLSLACFAVTALVVLVCSGLLTTHVFKSGNFKDVFIIYALLLFFPVFNTLASAVFNGLQQIRFMAILNIIASLLNVAAVIICAHFFGLKGVLLASAFSAVVSFFIYAYFIRQKFFLTETFGFRLFDQATVKLLLGYSAMNIVSGVVAPSLQLFVRTKLLHNFDSTTAGLWQANTRLSDYYLNFFYTVIGIYYLPKLSELTDKSSLKKEVWLGYLRILPPVIVTTILIWLFRYQIVNVFLTGQFEGMLVLLKWQLIGDVLKIASWILAYLMVAKAMKKMFITTEIVFSCTYVLLNYFFIGQFGLVGTVYAFAANYLLYLLVLVVLLRKTVF